MNKQTKNTRENNESRNIAINIIMTGIIFVFMIWLLFSKNKFWSELAVQQQESTQSVKYDEDIDAFNCPYCNEVPEFSSHSVEESSSGMIYYVRCQHEDHEIEFNSEISMANAIEKWNTFVEIINIANND